MCPSIVSSTPSPASEAASDFAPWTTSDFGGASTTEGVNDWSDQDISVLNLFFYHWDKAVCIESRKQPIALKSSALVKMLKSKWKPCGVKLEPGQYVRKVQSRRYDFDGRALLEFISKHRANTKSRAKILCQVKSRAAKYYDSVPARFQPTDRDMPMHLFWAKAESTFRPQTKRKLFFRKAKQTPSDVKEQTPAVEVTKVELPLQHQLDDAVKAIEK